MAIQNVKNYTIGKGKVYFRRSSIDATGLETKEAGYLFLGNAPSISFTVEAEQKGHNSSTSCVVSEDENITVSTKCSGTITIDDIKSGTLALFGQSTEPVQDNLAATPISGENIVAYEGQLMKLGETNNVGAVTAVVVNGSGGTPTYVEGTDYNADLNGGWIEMISGGGITDLDDLEVDYTPTAQTRETIDVGSSPSIKGTLIFQSDPIQGHKHDFQCDVTLNPDGELALVTEDWQSCGIKFNCRNTGDFPALMKVWASINNCA